jgi:hypothetical protein
VLVGARLDLNVVLAEDLRGIDVVLRDAVVHGHVVESATLTERVAHAGHLMTDDVRAHPCTDLDGPVDDPLAGLEPEVPLERLLERRHVTGHEVEVVDALDRQALQWPLRGPREDLAAQLGWCLVLLRLPYEAEVVPVR